MATKSYRKKADLNTKIGKYYLAKQKGLTKVDSQIEAGYKTPTHSPRIEDTKTYQAIEGKFKDTLEGEISLEETAEALASNIKQEKDKGARNTAIRMKLEISEVIGAEKEKREDTSLKVAIIQPILNTKEDKEG